MLTLGILNKQLQVGIKWKPSIGQTCLCKKIQDFCYEENIREDWKFFPNGRTLLNLPQNWHRDSWWRQLVWQKKALLLCLSAWAPPNGYRGCVPQEKVEGDIMSYPLSTIIMGPQQTWLSQLWSQFISMDSCLLQAPELFHFTTHEKFWIKDHVYLKFIHSFIWSAALSLFLDSILWSIDDKRGPTYGH